MKLFKILILILFLILFSLNVQSEEGKNDFNEHEWNFFSGT